MEVGQRPGPCYEDAVVAGLSEWMSEPTLWHTSEAVDRTASLQRSCWVSFSHPTWGYEAQVGNLQGIKLLSTRVGFTVYNVKDSEAGTWGTQSQPHALCRETVPSGSSSGPLVSCLPKSWSSTAWSSNRAINSLFMPFLRGGAITMSPDVVDVVTALLHLVSANGR